MKATSHNVIGLDHVNWELARFLGPVNMENSVLVLQGSGLYCEVVLILRW